MSVPELAELVSGLSDEHRSVLAVINTKSGAVSLYGELKERLGGDVRIFCLTTRLCPRHRSELLCEIQALLDDGRTRVVCVSTQLIEAGVDLDFDCALRSLAGLVNAVQTAGRCHRHGGDGKLVTDWKAYTGEVPQISKQPADETECFVGWRVAGVPLHEDEETRRSWTDFYTSKFTERGICYVTGREMPLSQLSPYKIRNSGDRAKLISSNDKTNFTFRGERFSDAREALHIGYETTQKAHSALRWLIGRQGISNGGQTILVWGTENEPIPEVTGDSVSFAGEDDLADELPGEGKISVDTARTAFAECFNRAARGYAAKLGEHSKISVMVLDAATPGRMSVKYYRELSGSRLMKTYSTGTRLSPGSTTIAGSGRRKMAGAGTLTSAFTAPLPLPILRRRHTVRKRTKG